MKPALKKFDAIESLRGWMAWWVVVGHALFFVGGGEWLVGYRLSGALGQGDLAVQVFMIVSGFVIAHLLVVKRENYRAYITRRWFRLVPLFLAMMALAIVTRDLYEVAFVQNPWASNPQMRIERLAVETASWPTYLLLHLSLLHGLVPDSVLKYSSSAFLSPAWSLSLEWQFYLVAPFLVAALSNIRKLWLAALAVGLSVPALAGLFGDWQYQSFLLLALPFFLIGITSRLLLDRQVPWLAIAITAAAGVVYAVSHGLRDTLLDAAIVGPIWSLFLLITAREGGIITFRSKLFDWLSWAIALNPVVVSVGRVSYSTYLCHIPILTIVIGGGIVMLGSQDRTIIAVLTVVGLILSAAVSFVTYRYIERPGIRLGAHWVERRPVDDEATA